MSIDVFQEFADQAPEEIRDDFQVLAQAYAEYVKVVGELDLQPGVVPSADELAAADGGVGGIQRPGGRCGERTSDRLG